MSKKHKVLRNMEFEAPCSCSPLQSKKKKKWRFTETTKIRPRNTILILSSLRLSLALHCLQARFKAALAVWKQSVLPPWQVHGVLRHTWALQRTQTTVFLVCSWYELTSAPTGRKQRQHCVYPDKIAAAAPGDPRVVQLTTSRGTWGSRVRRSYRAHGGMRPTGASEGKVRGAAA